MLHLPRLVRAAGRLVTAAALALVVPAAPASAALHATRAPRAMRDVVLPAAARVTALADACVEHAPAVRAASGGAPSRATPVTAPLGALIAARRDAPHTLTAAPLQEARPRRKASGGTASRRARAARTTRARNASRAAARASSSSRARTKRRAAPARALRPAAPAVTWAAVRGAPALAERLGATLAEREGSQWGAMVVSLTRGDTLFARHPDVPVVPASTLKMYTAALALERLGPDWRFRTSVLRTGPVDASGTVAGDLVLRGDGDPSLSRRFHAGNTYDAPMRLLAERVWAAGIRRVRGNVVADASAFEARTIPEGWLSRYAGAGYAAPFSALSLNENIVVVAVHPDGRVLLEPATTGIAVENQVRVTRGGGSALRIHRAADGHVVARGSIGRSAAVRRLQLTVHDPVRFTGGALHAALVARGIAVDGQLATGRTPDGATEVAALLSPPLADLVAVMNRESINIFAELLFRNAVRGPRREGEGSATAGNALLQRFLAERVGAPAGAVQVSDGSGLSVNDRVTARSMVHLLAHADRAAWGSAFHASLPVAGESELMRHRMRGTPAAGNLHAKTGTTNEVVGLGGYVTAENGEVLAFAFVHNGRDRWNARATIDAMGATLAAFSR